MCYDFPRIKEIEGDLLNGISFHSFLGEIHKDVEYNFFLNFSKHLFLVLEVFVP